MKARIQAWIAYGKTALEENPGVLSAMRCVQLPSSYLILFPVVTVWTYCSLKTGKPATVDHETGWMFVCMFLGVNGCKTIQSFCP